MYGVPRTTTVSGNTSTTICDPYKNGSYYNPGVGSPTVTCQVNVVCDDGSTATSIDKCPVDSRVLCWDGSKAATIEQCPVNPPSKPKNRGGNCLNDPGQFCGNPVNNTTGNKFQSETDYSGAGAFPLQLVRYYNSQSSISTGAFGANWSHGYGGHIALVSATQVDIFRGDEKTFSFKKVNGVWQAEADVKTTLVQLFDTDNNRTGWRYTTGSDSQEVYDVQGRLTTLTNRAGLTQTFSYDTSGRLITVSDAFGRQLAFTYDSQNRINSATDPLGNNYLYSYDANNNLISVTYADGAIRQYVYENSQYPHALTGIIDENGTRFATWSYDGDRAVSSEHAGGVEKVTLSHDASNLKTTVQDALGATHLYAYHTYLGVAHTTSDTRSCPDCVTSTRTMSYDNQGNLLSSTDFNGIVTNYSYDTARNLETSRTEAAGTLEARIITTQWHSNFRLPIKITSPDGIQSFDYNPQGLLIKRSETSTDGTQSRVWNYTYNANGQLTQVDGARTDVADLIDYSYDSQGNLVSVTNALGNITRIIQYDAAGHPLSITDPNGLITALSYDSRGRLITQDKGGEITRYTYDKTGALLTVSQPDNTHIDYRYDAAHRLINLQNSQGDSLTYTLDALGNRLREDWKNPSGTLTKTLQRQYDGFARLSRELGAQGQTTHYQYDHNDNLTQITDPLQRVTHYQYDSLNRLSQDTDPTNATTHYSYDASDRTTQVSDHNNNATQYSYDGLGNRIEQHSPDTGCTTASYDTAGNLLSRTDANGQTTTYRYDANNRPIETRFIDGTTINYQYDTAPNGIGRLANITDPSGTTEWQYDPHGRITAKLQTITLLGNNGNRTLITRYRYDSAGRLIETTYPSGLKVAYSYTDGNIASLKLNGKAWLNTIRYQPDGSVGAWTWADGSQQQRGYDQDGQLISQTLNGNQLTLNYDSVGNITALIDVQTTLNLNYDAADRLIAANSQHWQYDNNSNRIQQQDNSGVTDYTIDPTSNRLLSSTGANYQTYQHDANGNTLQGWVNQY